MLMMTSYTSQLFESKLNVFLNNEFKESSGNNDEEESGCDKVFGPDQVKVYIEFSYIGDTSNKIRNCHNSWLSKIKCN